MDVSDEGAVRQTMYGMHQDVAVDGLDDIFYELRTLGFQMFPFLCESGTFVGDVLDAELIITNAGLHVA